MSSSKGSGIQERATEETDASQFLTASEENLKYGNQALVPCTPSRLSQPRVRAWRRTTGKEGGPGSAELCPPCARRWRRRLANPGGPGLRPGGGRRACAAVAPAEPGRAQPWRSQAWDAHGPSHSPERCRQGAWGGHNKVKAPSKSLQREETRRRQSPRKPRAAPPAAASCGGISANFKNTRIPLAAFARCIGRASSLRCPRRGRGLGREGQLERQRGAAPPLPHATGPNGRPAGEETGYPRHAKLYTASPPRRWSHAPSGGEGPAGSEEQREVGAFPRVPAPQRSRVLELRLPPVVLAVAGKRSRDSGWRWNASPHSTRSGLPGARQGPLALARRRPAASSPIIPSTARAQSLGARRGARELAPRAGRRRQPSGPTSWRRRARLERGDPEPSVCGVSPSSSRAAGAGWTAAGGD
ncbi:uncharacterized protein [Equus asinus]|uniref:uncharacterized protein isoform X2 n=1 Tax=Equus asinus TaxID=9793 RepID=UPI0038F7F68E